MLNLKREQKTVIECEFHDLEDFIKERFLLESFEILESSNNSTHSYNVDGDVDLVDVEDIVKRIRSGGVEYWRLGSVLNLMALLGMLEKGSYLVEVSW